MEGGATMRRGCGCKKQIILIWRSSAALILMRDQRRGIRSCRCIFIQVANSLIIG